MDGMAIVWFKRDLRLRDHEPLAHAAASGLPVLFLYLDEPSQCAHPDYDQRHRSFVMQSLAAMAQELKEAGHILQVIRAEAVPFFTRIREKIPRLQLYSHEETGHHLSYRRDREVKALCRACGIPWIESQSNAVVRGLTHRESWNEQWADRMLGPQAHVPLSSVIPALLPIALAHEWPAADPAGESTSAAMQPGGEPSGHRYLDTFLQERVEGYGRAISRPQESRRSCSRLSPYLAWGNLSLRQVYQATLLARSRRRHVRQIDLFTARLHWHCHFVQKFESECAMEFNNLNSGYDDTRNEVHERLVKAWEDGLTGVPLVDACMRCLRETGYLNFRMRSMLVSFLTHHLWQPWQAGVHHLARHFLDYDPGIHYPQFQMQAGTTGVNTIRLYNPYKQAEEHDPGGQFIRKWVPELQSLPLPFVYRPDRMTPLDQRFHSFTLDADYPAPVVDVDKAAAHAREHLWKTKRSDAVRSENSRIIRRHVKPSRVPRRDSQ